MLYKFKLALLGLLALLTVEGYAQQLKNKGEFINAENKFYDEIKKSTELFANPPAAPKEPVFKMDFSGIDLPKSADEFTTVWAGKPVTQGATNTCWSFSTTSFYESEVKRITGMEVRLSEQYIVYYEYLEKAREYVRTRGASFFGEGSESNAVSRMMKLHGIVPYESYTGYSIGQKYLDHSVMFGEMDKYLKKVKENSEWNEQVVVSTIQSILDHYMGKVPDTVTYSDKKMSPVKFMETVLKLNPDDYIDIMSLKQKPYWTKSEYDVPDNWWNSSDYYNVPLEDFMNIIKASLKKGYSIAIGGDVSEPGILGTKGVALVPTFDIPSEYINEDARQLRFSNGSTTDDHGVHMVGWANRANGTWFLIKDSGSGAHNNPACAGYYFYHEDYVKLKMMSYTVHRDAVKEVLLKFNKS
jgi:bleomycin hydrolase